MLFAPRKFNLAQLPKNFKLSHEFKMPMDLKIPNARKLQTKLSYDSLVVNPECRKIIHNAALEAALIGAGLAQVPAADHILISALQINMVKDLAKAQGHTLSEGAIKGLLLSFMATHLGRNASKFLIGWVPLAGNIINAATAASITEAFGWAALQTMEDKNFQEA